MVDPTEVESLRLWDILERVGVSEPIRQLRRDLCFCNEIQETIVNHVTGKTLSTHMFGSYVEGTTTPGLNSDVDVVMCVEHLPVITDLQDAPAGRSLLEVTDGNAKPGYVKLQEVLDGIPLTVHDADVENPLSVPDGDGRICRKHSSSVGNVRNVDVRSGPADTKSNRPNFVDIDNVPAFRSKTFPRQAILSLLDCVRCGWLSAVDVEELTGLGCLYVGVGHPASDDREIEWRISLSLQERKLMFLLNPTQQKCYVLLKFIKDMLTSKSDVGKSLTSYHCKTCLLRVITKTVSTQWTPNQLIHFTRICLMEVLQCLSTGNLPNFFITANNMFEGRMPEAVRSRLIRYLGNIIQGGSSVFYSIQCNRIGSALRGDDSVYADMERDLGTLRYSLYVNMCRDVVLRQYQIYGHLDGHSNEGAIRYLQQQLLHLETIQSTCINGHTSEDTYVALQCLVPVFHKLCAQHLAALSFSTELNETRHNLLEDCDRHLRFCHTWDLTSGRLLHATILYRQKHYELSCDLLQQIERSLHDTVISICRCYSHVTRLNADLRKIIQSEAINLRSIMTSSIASCTIFLPAHSDIIPKALQYEMWRTVGTPPGLRDDDKFPWYEWAVVDSKVYVFFMQYVVSIAQNKAAPAQRSLETLAEALRDPDLAHRETGYNLVGWIYSQMGDEQSAARCFLRSWTIRPHNNAAKWHMLNLIYRKFVSNQLSHDCI